jgi:hypothetical protein
MAYYDDEYVRVYSNTRNFRDRVKEQYKVPNSLIHDDRLLLLIYTYEWFKLPKTNKFELVSYHPYLKQKDLDLANHISNKYMYMTFMPTSLSFLFGLGYFSKYYKKRASRLLFGIVNLIVTNLFGLCLWKYYFLEKMNEEVSDNKRLKKYFELDVDKDMVREELKKYKINV